MTQNRRSLILTGASRGIGHATVKRFSDEGWQIITCSRDPCARALQARSELDDPYPDGSGRPGRCGALHRRGL